MDKSEVRGRARGIQRSDRVDEACAEHDSRRTGASCGGTTSAAWVRLRTAPPLNGPPQGVHDEHVRVTGGAVDAEECDNAGGAIHTASERFDQLAHGAVISSKMLGGASQTVSKSRVKCNGT